ncbi:hypothetical protein DI383_02240 [Flavobacteriaceae bacterium LYZ1037]|nr:hypothetical protein DI383_02240 [Flavobacteriaceae bacterium LYZ1037]
MKTPIKIAIYSGVLPATTFIENLITEVGKQHKVYLFGTIKVPTSYTSKNIHIVETSTNQWQNIPQTILRVCQLLIKRPKRVWIAYKEAKRYKTPYEQWMRFSRFIPVLLYQPDVFHLQWASKIDRWMFLKQAYNCKIILSLLGSNINIDPITKPILKDWYLKHFPNIDAFHAVSHHLAKAAIGFGANPEKLKVIRTTILEETFNYFKPKTKLNETIELLSVGRHHQVKGYKHAILAIKTLKNQGVKVKYTIIAQGLVPEELLLLVQQQELQGQVFFKDGLPQEKLFTAMQNYDALVLPSLSEGIANVVLEAMLLGVPVISTNCGGMPEVVIPKETGWLVPVANPEALSNGIIDFIYTDKDEIEQITNNAFQLVNTQFDTQTVVKQYIELYESVCHSEGCMKASTAFLRAQSEAND